MIGFNGRKTGLFKPVWEVDPFPERMVDTEGKKGKFEDRFSLSGLGILPRINRVKIPGSLFGFFMGKDGTDLFFQYRKIVYTVVPEYRGFDPEICMSKDITETGNFFPVSFRVTFFESRRKILNRFPNHLKVTDDSILSSPVRDKFIK
jgi:hypothetical protein